MRALAHIALLATLSPFVAGCGASASGSAAPLHVFAASSLADAFAQMEVAFEEAHPNTDALITYAGSQVLRIQIEQGASADVVASADPRHMAALVATGHVQAPDLLALNELAVVTPVSNPARIESVADLVNADRLVIGTPSSPIGGYTRESFEKMGRVLGPVFSRAVRARIVSEENNVRLVRAKVELGEADAAIVYQSDAVSSNRVRVVSIPDSFNVAAEYPIAVVTRARNLAGARQWVSFVLSAEGQEVLERHGFGRVP